MQSATLRRRGVGVLASVVVGASSLVAATPAQAATAQPGYVAQAYGSYAFNANRSITSGPTAFSSISCGAAPGAASGNNSAQVNLPGGLGSVGAQVTTVQALQSGNTRTSVATSRTAGLNLLGGVITSGVIQTSTRTSFNGTSFSAVQSTSLASLKVLGLSVGANPGPNTKINLTLPVLGSVGYVELNRQVSRPENGGHLALTTGLHVVLLANNPWLPGAGYDIWVATSTAQLTKPATGFLKGQGFATRIVLANGTVSSGPTALAKVDCVGGTMTNTVASIAIPNVLTAGAATSTGVGSTSATAASAKVTDTIAGLNLLNGLVTATTIKAVATATRLGAGPIVLSDAGSQFVNLQVAGTPIAMSQLKPNTSIKALNGNVTITLKKIKKDARTIEVTMIELTVTGSVAGLPLGSRVEIGRAYAGITPSAG